MQKNAARCEQYKYSRCHVCARSDYVIPIVEFHNQIDTQIVEHQHKGVAQHPVRSKTPRQPIPVSATFRTSGCSLCRESKPHKRRHKADNRQGKPACCHLVLYSLYRHILQILSYVCTIITLVKLNFLGTFH